jgi:hypothetical protein
VLEERRKEKEINRNILVLAKEEDKRRRNARLL